MAVAVRTEGEPVGVGWFAVPSRTTPGAVWHVRYQGPALFWCGCPPFQRTQTCKHCAAVALAVEVEARRPATPERRAFAARRLAEIAEEVAS